LEVAKKRKRDIGAEILEGIRQLKRGEAGRSITVPSVTVPSVSETRARVGLS
jgi:putative transcriptional regulator